MTKEEAIAAVKAIGVPGLAYAKRLAYEFDEGGQAFPVGTIAVVSGDWKGWCEVGYMVRNRTHALGAGPDWKQAVSAATTYANTLRSEGLAFSTH